MTTSNIIVSYARGSTVDQNLDLQYDALDFGALAEFERALIQERTLPGWPPRGHAAALVGARPS